MATNKVPLHWVCRVGLLKIADSCLKIGVPCANIGQDGERPQLCHTVLQNFVHHFEHHFFGELVAPQGNKRA